MEQVTIPANLCAALAKAQAAFPPVHKGKTAAAGQYSYNYADLSDIIAAVSGPLHENGLVFMHLMAPAENGTVVTTILAHSSGEAIKSERLVPNFQKQQEFGSALTYTKRYQLSGLLGIAADDDEDGNVAEGKQATTTARNSAPPSPRPLPAPRQANGNGTNGASLPPHPEESGDATAARARIKMLIDQINHRIKTAPNDHALDLVMDDARESIAEIEKAGPAGVEAAKTLRARANARISELRSAT